MKALPEIIRKKKCSKVLIITDAGIRKLGLTRRLEKALDGAGVSYCIYDRTVANPTTDNVSEAMGLYLDNSCDCIIGFGGGSSMDCAKAVGARIAKPKQSLATDEDTPCEEAAGSFIQAVKDMKKRFGIGDHIPEIQETDIPKLAHYADKEANPLYPVPVLMDASELEPFYHMLMDEPSEIPERRETPAVSDDKSQTEATENVVEKGESKHDRAGN